MDYLETKEIDPKRMSCTNCVHFSPLPGFERTGICDENTLNKRFNVPVVLTASDDVCWEWEKDYE